MKMDIILDNIKDYFNLSLEEIEDFKEFLYHNLSFEIEFFDEDGEL